MNIHIADRLKWFSHDPGIQCLVPGTHLAATFFPAQIVLRDIRSNALVQKWDLPIVGPVRGFTVEQDLEKGTLSVFGHAKSGYFHFWLNDNTLSTKKIASSLSVKEKISFGSHKAHEAAKMRSRLDMGEIFPFWMRLGQLCPLEEDAPGESLLNELKKPQDRAHSLEPFQNLFLAGFDLLFVPRAKDHELHGFPFPPIINEKTPLVALVEGALAIRKLFIIQEGNKLFLLPHLPAKLPFGKMTDVILPGIGTLHLEWSKKKLRRMVLISQAETELELIFQKELKSFRLRSSLDARGKRVSCPHSLHLSPNTTYFFDNFQK